MLVLVMIVDLSLKPAAEGGPFHCHHSGDVLNEMEQTFRSQSPGAGGMNKTRVRVPSRFSKKKN